MTRALYNQIDAVERFAADVAHELKNPITSMYSALETIERTDRPDLQKKLLAIVQDDVRRLERLVSDVSDASRLDAELTRGDMAQVDVGSLLGMIVDGYELIGENRGVTVLFDKPEAGVYVTMGMESRLSQVWRNLIDNAISFSPENGQVSVILARKGKMLRVLVQDQGPGLPEGAEAKIFKRFYSERPDHETFGNHSGLGLAISKQIIEAHGGYIAASNLTEAGTGSILGAQFEVVCSCVDPFAQNQIDAKIFHGRVQIFFDGPRHSVDFVDE